MHYFQGRKGNSEMTINPFNELYLSEILSTERFVKLFSPLLVDLASSLFQPGHVVVLGVQGSGKSMLLGLMQTNIRIAYAAHESAAYPVNSDFRNFVSCGININTSGALDFGQRPIEVHDRTTETLSSLFFGDYFNYFVVEDLLKSISEIANSPIQDEIQLDYSPRKIDQFLKSFTSDDCWHNYMAGVSSIEELRQRIHERITKYRSYLNFNIDLLPESIILSKTTIGQPINQLVKHLKLSKIVSNKTNFFVQIDQYEDLSRLNSGDMNYGSKFRQVLNKALYSRDSSFFYRIGSRRHAWDEDLAVFGLSDANLEQERNFKRIDLDNILRRSENGPNLFASFARDVFQKRVSGIETQSKSSELTFDKFFGPDLSDTEMSRHYTQGNLDRIILKSIDDKNIRTELLEIGKRSPLDAKLFHSWYLQNASLPEAENLLDSKYKLKPYWRKERIKHALMHIAAFNNQKMIWSGKSDILSLSGGNVLVFVSICQNVWDIWDQRLRSSDHVAESLPVNYKYQTIGIHNASNLWFNKISEQSGTSGKRKRFIEYIGILLRKELLDDQKMSYPGHNGFSIMNREFEAAQNEVKQLIFDCVNFGDLIQIPHTSKSKDKEPRTKWYLHPVLSPEFRIPDTHVKEPKYIGIADLYRWIEQSNSGRPIPITATTKKSSTIGQKSLFE